MYKGSQQKVRGMNSTMSPADQLLSYGHGEGTWLWFLTSTKYLERRDLTLRADSIAAATFTPAYFGVFVLWQQTIIRASVWMVGSTLVVKIQMSSKTKIQSLKSLLSGADTEV